VYGPVCPVVWEGRRREAPPYPDLMHRSRTGPPLAWEVDIRSYGPGCSERGWPYYEASCIRNANAANRDAKPVRIIAIDRLPPGIELATSR
jgi:hypothetical protein